MKNRIYLIIIAILFPCFVIAQGLEDFKVSTESYRSTRDAIRDAVRDQIRVPTSSRSSDSREEERNKKEREERYERERYEREQERRWHQEQERIRKEKEREAIVIINKMDQLINNDCIDIKQIQNAIDEFNSLPDDLQKVQGVEGHNTRAKLMAQKNNVTTIYNKYSLMATNIRNLSFGGFNTRILSLSYEDLDKYLKQFLNKQDFERAKVEYKKYEKAKVLENAIEDLYAHWDDKKYLRENYGNNQKLKSIIEQQDALKHVNKYHLCLLEIIEKEVEYDEIRQIPLTVSNIKTTLASKKATKNNADWKKISKGMTSQRLLSVLGTLNSDNDNILPDFVREESGYYLFVGKPTETDTKVATKEYLVSKDGSEIKIFETEKIFSVAGESIDESNMSFMNTDLYDQEKGVVYKVLTNGMVNKLGSEVSTGVKAEVSLDCSKDELDASAGIGAEAFHGELSTAVRKAPIMTVYPDNTISFKQESRAVSIGVSLGEKVGVSISSELRIDTPIGSFAASKSQPNIDGALKQIDSDVVLGIIKSSIDNDYYKSDFDDETIGKAVVSGIRKEVENY